MSLHATLSEEAQARLQNQKRTSTISSVVIAALVIVIIFLCLGYFLLPAITKDSPSVTIVQSQDIVEPPIDRPIVHNTLKQKPSSPSAAMAPVIVSHNASALSIPVPDVPVTSPSVDLGDGQDFGNGWDTGVGQGAPSFEKVEGIMRKRCSKADRIARLQEMGGNPLAEDTVERGLEWLKATQNPDGSWTGKNQAAMTGFAILAYLGRCETPRSEKYGESCLRGIAWLIDLGMKNDGKLATNLADDHWPYDHAIATYALCEAATFCKNLEIPFPGLTEMAGKSTEFIIANQHTRTGGWDYSYDTEGSRGGDLSVAAWHIQALKAASHTGIEFKGMSRAKTAALKYAESLQNKNGGFGYTSASGPAGDRDTFTLTAAGILGLQMWGKESASAVRKGAKYILDTEKFQYSGKDSDLYLHYYASQAMLIRGGKEWETYNATFKGQLISSQNPNGDWKAPGSGGIYSSNAHYRNCLNILMLEVYYRFLSSSSGV